MSNYYTSIVVIFGVTFILSSGFSISYNLAGLPNLAHIVAYGTGAYTYAILSDGGVALWLTLVVAIVLPGLVGALIGKITSRVRADQFALVTLAGLIAFQVLLKNMVSITNGPLGISLSSQDGLGVIGIANPQEHALLASLVSLVCWIGVELFRKTKSHVVVRALREDEFLLESMGYRVDVVKACVSAGSFVLAGIAGIIFASYLSFVDPSSFAIGMLLPVLFVVTLAGVSPHSIKIFIASALVVAIPEVIKIFDLPDQKLGALQQLMFAIPLVIILIIQGRSMRSLHD